MRNENVKQAIKLRLLTLVLVLALTWYAINPAPAPVQTVRRDEDRPDDMTHEARLPTVLDCDAVWADAHVPQSASDESVENLEWPEVIDFG